MKQKLIIGFSVGLLLLAVFLIARDLFRNSPTASATSCCGDDFAKLKKMDSSQIGYTRVNLITTNLKDLSGIALDASQNIFVCGDRQVIVFDRNGKKTGGFEIDSAASCIALKDSELFLGMGPRIAHYNMHGDQLAGIKPYHANGFITSIAIYGDQIFAADAVSKRVLKYATDGRFIQEIGRKDSITGSTGFVIPSLYFDIAFGAFNDLWVVNPGKLSIENYTPTGYMQSAFENSGFTGCCNPAHIAVLPNGNFVTYEKGIDKIKVFDPTGKYICLVAGAGSFKGNTDFQLGRNNLVKDMAAGPDGKLYVLDAYNQINVFKKTDI
jgi:DNA-binding beta-propeller fold protein YncE